MSTRDVSLVLRRWIVYGDAFLTSVGTGDGMSRQDGHFMLTKRCSVLFKLCDDRKDSLQERHDWGNVLSAFQTKVIAR